VCEFMGNLLSRTLKVEGMLLLQRVINEYPNEEYLLRTYVARG
jgi:hypothetical protein